MKRPALSPMQYLAVAVLVMALTACASIGRPEGGPRDVEPPVFVTSTPLPGALNVDRQRIDLFFNENVQLEDAFNKVVVSPAQKNAPQVSSNGRHVTVHLRDSLLPNTTYTIDFADAIKDLNEGNILDGFATDFSTGDSIDSLRISGIVLQAMNLEPAQGMLVGIHSNMADSAISTLPFNRIARTNQLGQFTIRNVKPGSYRLFAINDINRDYKWDRSEDIAVYPGVVSPYAEGISVTDTLRSSAGTDSLVARAGTAFYPNDLLLTWFNEGYTAQYLKDYSRPDRRRVLINMAAPCDSLPQVTIAAGPMEGRDISTFARLHASAKGDSLEYWLADSAVVATDSLLLAVRYLRTDTADMLTWREDTLKFFYKEPKTKGKKKKDEEADTLPPQPDFLSIRPVTGSQQEIYMPLIFEISQPIDTIDAEGFRLEMAQDSLWVPVEGITLAVDSVNPLVRRSIAVDWKHGEKYRLTFDSAAVRGIYGEWNNTYKMDFKVKTPEDYSNLVFTVTGAEGPAVVEILSKSDEPVRRAPVVNGEAHFPYMTPGVVYARLFMDSNGNGIWDAGNVADSIQPEDVYYYPKKLNLRKNWDVTQSWDINELPVDAQKPYDIKKNKPKLKKGEKPPVQQGDEDEDDEFGSGAFGNNGYGGNSNINGRRPSNGRSGGNRGGMGGFGGMGGLGGSMGLRPNR